MLVRSSRAVRSRFFNILLCLLLLAQSSPVAAGPPMTPVPNPVQAGAPVEAEQSQSAPLGPNLTTTPTSPPIIDTATPNSTPNTSTPTPTATATPTATPGQVIQILPDFNTTHALSDVVHLGDNLNDTRFIRPNPSGTVLTHTFTITAPPPYTSSTLLIDQYNADGNSFVHLNGVFIGYLT